MARQHATPADFELVGMSGDPTPGDPEIIQAILQRYASIGDAAERALGVLQKDGSLSAGRGSAMDKLREKVGTDLPDKLRKTATSYHDAASAYRNYIPRLKEAQETFDRAVEQAVRAASQANLAPPPPLPADATDQQRADARTAQQSIDEGKQQMSAARGLAEQALAMRQSAQRECADVLDRAAGEAIPERNIFQKISDFFEDFPFVQILLGLLVAIVSVFFPVVGLLLAGALFAITQIAAIASGKFKLGDFLVGLLSLVPGASVLKIGGGLVKAGAGVVEKFLPNLVKTIKGSITAIKLTIKSSKSIGPILGSSTGKLAVAGAKGFGDKVTDEVATEVLNKDELDAGKIFGAGAAGAVGGGVAKKFAPKTGGSGGDGIPLKTGPNTRNLDGGVDPGRDPSSVSKFSGFKAKDGEPLVFTHDRHPGEDFVLHRTDPSGFDEPVFKVKRTGEKVFQDIDDGNTFKKFSDTEGFQFDKNAEFGNVAAADRPVDHFVLEDGGGGPLPKVNTIDELKQVGNGRVVLVRTSALDSINLRGDLPRADQVIKLINDGVPMPPIKLNRGNGPGLPFSLDDGNHRLGASRGIPGKFDGFDFVPVTIA